MYQPNYYTLTFLIRSARANRSGEAPIFARISVAGQRTEFNVNRNVAPENWNAAKGMAKGRSKKDLELNKYIDSIRVELNPKSWTKESLKNVRQSKKKVCQA